METKRCGDGAMHLTKLTRTVKIAFGLSIVLIVLVGITVFSIKSILEAQNHVNRVAEDISVRLAALEAQGNMIRDIQIRVRNIGLLEDSRPMRDELNKLQAVRNIYDESEARLNKLFGENAERGLVTELVRLRAVGRPLTDRAIDLGLKNRNAEVAKLLIEQVAPNTEQRLKTIEQLIEQQQGEAQRAAIAVATAHNRAVALTVFIGILAAVLSLATGGLLLFFSLVVDSAGTVGDGCSDPGRRGCTAARSCR